MYLLSKTLEKTYRHHGGEGPVGFAAMPDGEGPAGVEVAPVRDGEGSVDACREACCTEDIFNASLA